jgi:hypothetical protein
VERRVDETKDFVRVTTDQASPKFVPPEEQIATFDQDDTLWVEPWTSKPINLAITRSLDCTGAH